MYEVILTFRPDFAETVAGRYATEEEALAVAESLSVNRPIRILRVWVRRVTGVPEAN